MLKAHTQNYQVSIIAIWVVFFIPSLHNLLVIGPPLLKSSETLAEMAKISYFRTLEISQRLPTIWGVFIQEKLLSLIEQGLWHCSLNCSHLSLLRSAVTLKSSRLATTGWAGLVWGTSKKKKPIPKALSLFDLLSSSLEEPCFIVVTWPEWSSELDLQENPGLRAFVKNWSVATDTQLLRGQ